MVFILKGVVGTVGIVVDLNIIDFGLVCVGCVFLLVMVFIIWFGEMFIDLFLVEFVGCEG